MVNIVKKLYSFTLNKLAISAFIVLVVGVIGGYGLNKLESMRSDASMPCKSENHDVEIYAAHLASILSGGKKISSLQMNTLLDLIEIRDECESDWRQQQMLAYL